MILDLNKNKDTSFFDGARGIAVLIVWLSHTSGREQTISDQLNFHGIGHIGVMLFFVLSGYLLSMSIKNWELFSFKSYLIKRFFRIAPLYYTVLILVILYQKTTNNISERYLYINGGYEGFINHILFFQGDSVFWTISAEFVFYLILPLIVFLIFKYEKKAIVLFILFSFIYSFYHLAIYIKIIELPGLKFVKIHHSSQFIDVFVIGVIFGMMSNNKKIQRIHSKYKLQFDLAISFIFFLTLLISLSVISKYFLFFERTLYPLRFVSIGYSIVFGLSLLSAQFGNKYLRYFFQIKLFIFMGIIGFSWYLLHMPILSLTNTLMIPTYSKFFLSTTLVAIISLLAYKTIEEPFFKFGRKICDNLQKKRH